MTSVKEKARAAAPVATSRAWGHLMGAGAFLTVVLFYPPLAEAFILPKVLVLTAMAFGVIPLIWARREALLAQRVPMAILAGFLVCVLASQLFSGAPQAISMWGEWFRRSGTLTTLSLALVLAAASVLTRPEVRTVLVWVVWSGVPGVAYGLVQLVGADPFPWSDQGWIVATFGNPNFAAAGMAMLAVLTAGMAIFGGFATLWRVLMAPLAALEALLALQTGSSQGLFALAVGVFLGAVAWLLRWDNARRAQALIGTAVVAVLGGALTVLALLGIGPLAPFVSSDTLMFRQWYWSAALGMAGGHPIFGVGPDGYGRFYGEYRTLESNEMLAVTTTNAHSVPLQWGATLGIPAALLYVALVIAVAVVVLRRLWQQGPEASPLAIAALAMWGAYQIQSLVSIDATAVALLGWLGTGLLLALTKGPGQCPPTSVGRWVTAAVLGVVGLLAWMPALLAATAAANVEQGTTEQDVVSAMGLVESTTLPCVPSAKVATWILTVAPSEQTIGAVYAGAEADDRCYALVGSAADLALQVDQPERALAFAEQSVVIQPLDYTTWILLARAQQANGDGVAAAASLDRALELAPFAQADIDQAAQDMGLPWGT